VEDGKKLSSSSFSAGHLSVHHPILVSDTPSSIGRRVIEAMNVREVADLVCHATPVNVMDVEYQEGTVGTVLLLCRLLLLS